MDAPNLAIAPSFQVERQWHRVGDPGHSAKIMRTCILIPALCTAIISCGCAKSTSEAKSPEVAVVADGKSTMAEAIPSVASFLQPLGVRPLLGRDFLPEELRKGSPAVAIISSEFWADAFASRPDAIGRTIQIANQDFVIVGVAPPSLKGRKVWLALQN